jgi:drug/metabolite transporter (DMT)-like permease
LASAAIFGLYSYLGRSYAQRLGSAAANSISFLLGGGFAFLLLPAFRVPIWQVTSGNILPLLYLSIFVTGLAYYAYLRGLSLLPPAAGSAAFFAKPALSALLAWFVLGEQLVWWKLAGIAVIIAGMTQTVSGKGKLPDRQSPPA